MRLANSSSRNLVCAFNASSSDLRRVFSYVSVEEDELERVDLEVSSYSCVESDALVVLNRLLFISFWMHQVMYRSVKFCSEYV